MNLIRLNTVYANDWLKLDFSNNLNLICSELVHVSDWYVVCRFLWFSLVKVQWKSIPQIPFLISPSIRQFFCEFMRIQVYRTCLIIDLKTCPKMASKGLETDVSNQQATHTNTLCSIPKQNLSQTNCSAPTPVVCGISELRCCNIQILSVRNIFNSSLNIFKSGN